MTTWDSFQYFAPAEFDSPDAPGSGIQMDLDLIDILDKARAIAGVPFRISDGGGYRTAQYNQDLLLRNPNASPRSLHLQGMAADIVVPRGDNRTRAIMISALMDAGIQRLGLAQTFIHVDIGGPDTGRRTPSVWIY